MSDKYSLGKERAKDLGLRIITLHCTDFYYADAIHGLFNDGIKEVGRIGLIIGVPRAEQETEEHKIIRDLLGLIDKITGMKCDAIDRAKALLEEK